MSLSPKDALRLVQQHINDISPDKFAEEVGQYCIDEAGSGKTFTTDSATVADSRSQIALFRSHPSPLSLDAYLASALTGLTEEQRETIFSLSDLVASVCEAHQIKLYGHRKGGTDPKTNSSVKDSDVFKVDRERVLSSDLLIHLCHFPGTGAGEPTFAYSALIPLILIAHNDNRVNRMMTGVPSLKFKLTYQTCKDLEQQLDDCLLKLRPLLEQRKMAFSEYDANVVGNKIRMLREELGLTRADVAKAIPDLTVEQLRLVEESCDRHSDPSLTFLRRIATVLNTTVADLVQPDLGETFSSFS